MANTPILIAEGFNPNFFTSFTTHKDGMTWNCTFEMGFAMGDKPSFIKDFPEEAKIEQIKMIVICFRPAEISGLTGGRHDKS